MPTKKKEPERVFDFDVLYAKYPRKGEGKKRGMERLRRTITTEAQYNAFSTALDNYLAVLAREGRDLQYTKMWITFVNNWTDYLEVSKPPEGGGPEPKFQSTVQRILRGEL